MFRLFCAASLSAGLLACGSVARTAVLCDHGGAVAVTACGGCGAAVVVDDRTGRRGPCGCDGRGGEATAGRLVASR